MGSVTTYGSALSALSMAACCWAVCWGSVDQQRPGHSHELHRLAARRDHPAGHRQPVPARLRTLTGAGAGRVAGPAAGLSTDRKSTRLNSSHVAISYAVFCSKKKMLINGNDNGLSDKQAFYERFKAIT